MENLDRSLPRKPFRLYGFNKPAPIDVVLENASKFSVIWLGIFAAVVALELGQFFLAPILLAIVIGLMFIPVAKHVESLGVAPSLSAIAVVCTLLALLVSVLTAIAIPLSTWAERLPIIWFKLTQLVESWQDTLSSVNGIGEIISQFAIAGGSSNFSIADAESVKEVAWLAPGFLAQCLIFMASIYFFIATRNRFREAALTLCMSRGLKLRVARVFRDIELSVGSYLLQISIINLGLGLATGLAMWLLGLPSPVLWGVLACALNYIIYLGPAVMATLLFMVGLSLGGTPLDVATPAMVFLAINAVEANIVTPNFLGRTLTMNPFVVFLSLAFWIWLWGPIGGFVAVPSLLMINAIISNILLPNRAKSSLLARKSG